MRIAVTEPPCGIARLDWLSETVTLMGPTATNVTVPENRPTPVTVIVLVALAPIDELIIEGLALIEKSPTFTVSVTVRVSVPLVAVSESV